MTGSLVVGVDLVPVDGIRESLHTFGDRFVQRIFTPSEIDYCQSRQTASESYAARFAAKEAVIKALDAHDVGIDWRSIEVVRASGGACHVRLHGVAAETARRRGIVSLSLSLSHAAGFAIAMVVGQTAREEAGE